MSVGSFDHCDKHGETERVDNVYVLVFKGNPRDCAIRKMEFTRFWNNRFYYSAWYNPIEWGKVNIFI